jgi:hypothetical protein
LLKQSKQRKTELPKNVFSFFYLSIAISRRFCRRNKRWLVIILNYIK